MQASTSISVEKPTHVPAELCRDVDIFHLIQGNEDAQEAWWRLQQTMPQIFWTPHNGGHWIATRADLIEEIQEDYGRFSHRQNNIPPVPHVFPVMLNMDPPEHTPLRKIIMPALNKSALAQLEDEARKAAKTILDDLAPKGECEFISEFAQVLPIVVFLDMMGLPQEDRPMLLPWAEVVVRGSDVQQRAQAQANMAQYIMGYIQQRMQNPGSDLVSKIAQSQVDDRPISFEETTGMCLLLLFGGLDTVASMIGFIARYLALHPDVRHRLVSDPDIMQNAIEELIRRHGLANTAREVTHDIEFHGVSLHKGDLMQIPNALHGLDDRRHADPLKVDFDRPAPIRHAAFGNGPHICPGGILARREVKVFLLEWLARIPDFEIKPGTRPVIATGMVNGVQELHLVWKPAQ